MNDTYMTVNKIFHTNATNRIFQIHLEQELTIVFSFNESFNAVNICE